VNAPSSTPTLRAAGRRARFWVIAGVGVVAVSVAATLIAGGAHAPGAPLAADNAAPDGARAVIEVLRGQSVTVTVAGTLGAARAAAAGAADPVLFFSDANSYLDAGQLTAMAGLARRTVVAGPDFLALQTLAPGVGFGGVARAGVEAPTAQCTVPAAVKAGTLAPGGSMLSLAPKATGEIDAVLTGCFPGGRHTFALVEQVRSGRALTLLAGTAAFSNDKVGTAGNAALALNLLGASDTVVWYLPTLADVARDGPPSLGVLTPGWVTPTLLLLVLAALAAMIWRGRRFGPLVAENLPVTVRAGETMEGRARLYARGNARLRAIDALRIGAVQRLARRVGLPRTASLDDIVVAVAAITGWESGQVRAALVDTLPARDDDLIALSDRIRDLELDTIRATTPHQPGTTPPHGRMDP
jgi:hypothetical protein